MDRRILVPLRKFERWAGCMSLVASVLMSVPPGTVAAQDDRGWVRADGAEPRAAESSPGTTVREARNLYLQVVQAEPPAAEATPPGPQPAEAAPAGPQPAEPEGPPSLLDLSLERLAEQPVLLSQAEPVATTLSGPTATVTPMEQPIVESPGTVYVYTRELIQHRGYRSLGELLHVVPGFTIFHRDLQYVVGVRGFNANDNDKVSLLINGQRVLGMHEQEFLNGPINLDNVERVEVVVGPSSLFQQANTLAATINVITKDIQGAEVIGAVGTSLKYSATAMAGQRWAEDKFLNFSFTTEEKRGFDAWDPNFRNNLAGKSLTGELEQPNYFGVLRGRYGEWSAQAIAYRSTWPELLINNGDPANDGAFTEDFCSLMLGYEHEFDAALTGVADFKVARCEQTRLNRGGPPDKAAEVSFMQWVYQAEMGLRYTGFDRHLLQAGVQASYDHNFDTYFTFNDSSANLHIPPTTMVDRDTYALGFYIDDQVEVTDRLKLIGGVRIDENTRLPDDEWYPGARAAVVYELTKKWITKLVYNRSVRIPSPAQSLNTVWGSNNKDQWPVLAQQIPWAYVSPTVDAPEVLSTVELHNVFYLEPVRLAVIVYHEELADFITWFQPWSNGGNFRGNGAELTLDAEVNSCLTIWGNAAWNDTQLNLFNDAFGPSTPGPEQHHAYVNPDGRIIGSAAWTGNVGVDYKIAPHLTFSPAVRYFTEQAGIDQVTPAEFQYVTIRNQFYLDAGLTWDHIWCRDMDIRLAGRNLLDNRQPVGAQLAGDTYRPRGIEITLVLDTRF